MVSWEPPWKDASTDTHTPQSEATEVLEAAKTTSNKNGYISGRRSRIRLPIVSFEPPWKDASIDTTHTIITNIVVNVNKLTPVINIHSRISLRIFEKIRNGPKGILMGPRDTDLWKKVKSKISCQTSFKQRSLIFSFYKQTRRVCI
jgi:hypothetical protein